MTSPKTQTDRDESLIINWYMTPKNYMHPKNHKNNINEKYFKSERYITTICLFLGYVKSIRILKLIFEEIVLK